MVDVDNYEKLNKFDLLILVKLIFLLFYFIFMIFLKFVLLLKDDLEVVERKDFDLYFSVDMENFRLR